MRGPDQSFECETEGGFEKYFAYGISCFPVALKPLAVFRSPFGRFALYTACIRVPLLSYITYGMSSKRQELSIPEKSSMRAGFLSRANRARASSKDSAFSLSLTIHSLNSVPRLSSTHIFFWCSVSVMMLSDLLSLNL